MQRTLKMLMHGALVAVALSAAAALAAEHAPHSPDAVSSVRGIETSSQQVVLPASDTGGLLISPCATCKAVSLRLTKQTQYFVGRDAVSLKDLAAFVRGKAYFMMVFANLKEPTVERIVVSGHLPQTAKAR
jgi:hypothetical protein